MKNFGKSFGWFWMCVLPMVICVVLQFVLGLIGTVLFGFIRTVMEHGPEELLTNREAFSEILSANMMKSIGLAILVFQLANLAIFGLWYFLAVYRKKRKAGKRLPELTVQSAGMAVLFGVSLCLFTNQLVTVGGYLFPGTVEAFYRLMEQAGFGTDLAAIIAAVLLAPIGEELLCRGVIQHYAGKVSRRFWVANIIQALMFGILHMNMVQGIYAFCIGLVMGWLRFRYDSLIIPMIIHFVVNFSTSSWLGGVLAVLPNEVWFNVLLLIVSVGITGLGLFLVEKSRRKPEEL